MAEEAGAPLTPFAGPLSPPEGPAAFEFCSSARPTRTSPACSREESVARCGARSRRLCVPRGPLDRSWVVLVANRSHVSTAVLGDAALTLTATEDALFEPAAASSRLVVRPGEHVAFNLDVE